MKKKSVSPLVKPLGKPLGILGGGQLARMLALKAHELGIPVAIYSESKQDPAAQVVANWHQGSLQDPSKLKEFLSSCSLVTFESEFMNAKLLGELSRETGVGIWPEPKHMHEIQDRLPQKDLLARAKIPTARFAAVSTRIEAERALQSFSGQAVFKRRRFGYDGYGTFVVRTPEEFQRFSKELESDTFGFIGEELISFKRELAIIFVRSHDGSSVALPTVESFQENARCLWVKGPIKSSPKLKSFERKFLRLLGDLNYVGAIGVELFEGKSGEILVNELAPRVHNSGHYSLDALMVDQFTLHLRAVTGMSLSPTELVRPGFAMWNLLGTTHAAPAWQLPTAVFLHWYGKLENRPGRKMGHLNSLGKTADQALARVKRARKSFAI